MQQAKLGVCQIQVSLDWLDHQCQNLPVNKRKNIGQHTQQYDVPGIYT